MALARIEFPKNYAEGSDFVKSIDSSLYHGPQARLFYASIGNIEVRLLGSSEPVYFNLRRGVVGSNTPNAVVTEHPWNKDNILVMHSDGLTTRWHPKDFPNLSASSASDLAQELLNSLSKQEDDATVIVIKNGRKEVTW
jgi:serine/threonine protein phosphatase PrpC